MQATVKRIIGTNDPSMDLVEVAVSIHPAHRTKPTTRDEYMRYSTDDSYIRAGSVVEVERVIDDPYRRLRLIRVVST